MLGRIVYRRVEWGGYCMFGATVLWASLACSVMGPSMQPDAGGRAVEVPIGKDGQVRVAEIVGALATATGIAYDRSSADLSVSTQGLARGLTRALLAETLGPEVAIEFRPHSMLLSIDGRILVPERRGEWAQRLQRLAERAGEAAKKKQAYGMRALQSYRPNDSSRPTICLVHGLNSSSGGFRHMIPQLEKAGYGVVIFDYAFNRGIAESCAAFARDWAAFRRQAQDDRPWTIIAHSMGALVARSLIEDDRSWTGDVSSLILIAPVNQGSHLSRVQTMYQLINGLKAINGKNTAKAILSLSDGLGQAAQDLLPGSAFLKTVNARPRRREVVYHILAGDNGFLTQESRRQLEARIGLVTRNSGIFGQLTRAATSDLSLLLDELTDGTGDGCVAVERSRLEGVADHVTIHANHAELIRAPMFYANPGPVACMPYVLRWLREDAKKREAPAGAGASTGRSAVE
jgi:pimeloyl-ACP methyl ester carboxylesterase